MTLRDTMAGALPDLDVRAPDVPREANGRRQRTRKGRKRWTAEAMARVIGIGVHVLRRLAAAHPDVAALLGAEGGRFRVGGGREVTEAAVREGGRALLATVPWAPRLGFASCQGVDCRHPGREHYGLGLCEPCWRRGVRAGGDGTQRRRGVPRSRGYADAWDQATGRSRCKVCLRSRVRHHGGGLCGPCHLWARGHDAGDRAAVAARRERLRRADGRAG